MLKSFHLTAFLSSASILFIASSALARSASETFQSSDILIAETDTPVCYMQAADGTTLNLNSLCGKVPKNSTPPPSNPTNYQNSASPPSNPIHQSCHTKDECLRILGPDNFPRPIYVPKDGSPAG